MAEETTAADLTTEDERGPTNPSRLQRFKMRQRCIKAGIPIPEWAQLQKAEPDPEPEEPGEAPGRPSKARFERMGIDEPPARRDSREACEEAEPEAIQEVDPDQKSVKALRELLTIPINALGPPAEKWEQDVFGIVAEELHRANNWYRMPVTLLVLAASTAYVRRLGSRAWTFWQKRQALQRETVYTQG
jgi:hypothetical protein